MSEERQFDFDIAVSFAGEDRDYVNEVVEGVKAAGHSVFYDDDHLADMWGEDGVEYLTNVYMNRARYTVMFISRHYGDKMWPRLERRAALSRALTERRAYVLPVRLDATELDGLLPTVIYVEANRVGLSGLIELVKVKLGGPASDPTGTDFDGRVPRTQEAVDIMIAERPHAWEWILFAGLVHQGVEALEAKYNDHRVEYAARTGVRVTQDTLHAFAQGALAEMQTILENFHLTLSGTSQEAAFGAPGEPGDVDRIMHLARRFVSIYEDFIDWAAALRGAAVSGEHGRAALRLLASSASQPIETIREATTKFVAECDTLQERLDAGETVSIEFSIILDLEEGLMDRYVNELRLALEE